VSAICGIVHRNGQAVETQAIERIMTALDAYGPDGSYVWQKDSVALGHQMLHITPESLEEKLPWQDEVTGLVITADARIDNREELFAALAISPQVGRTISDSQLILRTYVQWGEQCLQKLLGDFAFAIWDARQQKLFCARDIFGVRPFFYYCSPTCFVFASDLNALLATSKVPRQLNEALIYAWLQLKDIRFAQKSLTFYEEIYKLPPAHYLTLTPIKQEIKSYWSPEDSPQIKLSSEAEYQEMLLELLERAISCRLRSAFPVGAHLSGGLDSSGIAVVAARALRAEGKVLKGFSWSPPMTSPIDSPEDERILVEEVCKREQIECKYLSLTGQDFLNLLHQNFLTEPKEMLDFEQKVQAEIAAQNIRVVLSGWGGDEAITFNGRGYFAELFLKGYWRTLYRELKLRGELHGVGLKWQLIDKVILPLLPDFLAIRWPHLAIDNYEYADKSVYVNPKLSKKIQSRRKQLPQLHRLLREQIGVRNNQLLLLKDGHLTRRIEDWAISAGQNHFVYSYPLLDRRIVEFALGIPVDLFFKQGWKRYLFRSATEDLLPERVRWRKSKMEYASFAQLRTSKTEVSETFKDFLLTRFWANRHSSQLAEFLDLEKLEQSIVERDFSQPGLGRALTLVAALAETNSNKQVDASQNISYSLNEKSI
jgi:asparagine synthase (glutamine-hydrolysing)